MSQEPTFLVPCQLLPSEPAHPLEEAAFDLAAVHPRVQGLPHVMDDVRSKHPVHAGVAVHFHFAHRGAAGEIVEGMTFLLFPVPGDPRRGVVARGREADALVVRGFAHVAKGTGWPPPATAD